MAKQFGSCPQRFLVHATLLVLPALTHADQAVVRYETPDGRHVEIDIDARFPTHVQRLVPGRVLKPGVPVLHSRSNTGNQVASLAKGKNLTVWQLSQRKGDRPHAIRATIRQSRTRQTVTPSWWPALLKPWSRRATDRNSTTITMLGWSVASLAGTRLRIQNAAARAGLVASDLANVGRLQKTKQQNDLLLFTGKGREMMVTLSRFGHRIGVVAHLKEVRR